MMDVHKLAVVIEDVSGHGVASSLITSLVKANMTHLVELNVTPSELFVQSNTRITDVIEKTDFFLTAFYLTIDENDVISRLSMQCTTILPIII